MSRLFHISLGLISLASTGYFLAMAADVPLQNQRVQADKLYQDGQFKEALELFRSSVLRPENQGDNLDHDIDMAVNCLGRLQQFSELDSFLAEAIESHSEDWRVYWKAADKILNSAHYGYVVGGEFQRGQHRGGGQYVSTFDRDRAQSLQWLFKSRELMPDDVDGKLAARFFVFFGNAVFQGRSGNGAWQLNSLTDLSDLPDFIEGYQYGRGRSVGAPVNEDGSPLYIDVPESLEAAKSDGERWRWLITEVARRDPQQSDAMKWKMANFAHELFGVRTVRNAGLRLPESDADGEETTGTWELSSLAETETIARLASGVRRFELREDYNFISIYRDLAERQTSSFSESAYGALAQIFEDRQQYNEAAKLWKSSIEQHGDSRNQNKQRRLDQIVKNWGVFEPHHGQPAGDGAKIDFLFRNGNEVAFEAYELNVELLLRDVQNYLKSSPRQIDWNRIQIGNIGHRIVEQNETKYRGDRVANWTLKLDPRPEHFDRRVTVTTPLQKAGAYLLISKMKDGNTSRVVIWQHDTAIVRKSLNGKTLYYIADAVTGKPIPGMKVNFFGWKQERIQNTKRDYHVRTAQHAALSDQQGMVLADDKLVNHEFQWLATAANADGRMAFLGFSHIWYGRYHHQEYDTQKVYVVTDRPVYRPDQSVQFKFWIRHLSFEGNEKSNFANRQFTVKINDPQGTAVFKQAFTTDEYGGLTGEFKLPRDAKLGQYYLYIDPGLGVSGGNNFRVEEYKKPEFEVTIDTPEKPVQLGEKVTATVLAKYYFGAPVAEGKVQLKVERSSHDSRWFPVTRWDWLYGNGFWWYTQDYIWYPGFHRWGCLAPHPFWRPWNPNPPELVLDQELEIGPDGTVEFEIDTALAKAIHGDEDHEYKITAEVTDASRRTIVGTGSVLVSREPFQVFSWTDQGHYRVGDEIKAHFQARTLAGTGVKGEGKLQLLKVTYEEGEPKETVVEEWDLSTDDEGHAEQRMLAQSAGQYRLSYSVTAEEKTIDGGYLFVVRGDGFDGSDYRFNALELVADQKTYQSGEKVELLINTDRRDATVLLFLRPENGLYAGAPQVIHMQGKSQTVSIDVTEQDLPNFYIEAVTVANGDVHTVAQQIAVPPVDRVINVEVLPDEDRYQPGQSAKVKVKLTDQTGEPVSGAIAISVYDRSVEYISGGSNVAEIREFFWNWKRGHHPQTEDNLQRYFQLLFKSGEVSMNSLGAFGDEVADRAEIAKGNARLQRRSSTLSKGAELQMMSDEAMPMSAPTAGMSIRDASGAGSGAAAGGFGGAGGAGGAEPVQPVVRENFADTAFWKADLLADQNGIVDVSFDMPENLTGWKLRAWGLGHGTHVGEGTSEVVTAKNLVVRLQAPRFFVEKDEVVLSAVVHNYLDTEKQVQVGLTLTGETLALIKATDQQQMVTIPAGGEARVDWRVRAIAEGIATVTMQALTDEESDAMKMDFPVFVHGFMKTESFSGVIRPNEENGRLVIQVPDERRPEESRLEIRYSPTLAGAMVDALPYLVEFPYGCTEQTLNRFVPTVITQGILKRMNLDLAAIQKKRTNLNAQEIGDDQSRAARWKRFDRNPVFDQTEVDLMVQKGLQDLTAMQNSDGGWGWFSGYQERSYPHTTAVVVHGLQQAQANGVAIVDGVLERGVAWLQKYQTRQVELLQEGVRHSDDSSRKQPYKLHAENIDSLVFSVLVDAAVVDKEMLNFLYRDRLQLSLYAQAQLGLSCDGIMDTEKRDMIIRNLDQFVKVDDENQTAYLELANDGYWWFWYGSQVEANAHYLKLLVRTNPQDPKAAGLVKYLLNNRKHGTYWTNTRDTAYCIEALADYLIATNELSPDLTVEILVDGKSHQAVEITAENLFSFENAFVIEGEDLTAGEHVIEIRKSGKGPLYHNAYLTYFSLEDFITRTGLEIKVERKFYKLVQDDSATTTVSGSRGQAVDQKRLKYRRVELESLSQVASGDLIEVELEIESKNDYEYVIFEDLKAAGAEAVDLRSGYTRGGLGAYVEFRDERVAFFMRRLQRGRHSVSYRLRAEIPGQFSALPARAYAMYAPELKANSDEMKIQITDSE